MNRFFLAALLCLVACAPQPTARPPLEGSSIGGPFSLVDGGGRTVSDRSFAGRYRIMYFGYTFCPDVCPTDMANLSAGLRLFASQHPDDARKLVLVFVTVDPERDTPPVVRQFAAAFGPEVVGLTGSRAEIDRVMKAYAIYAKKAPSTDPGAYLVDHSRTTYLMGPDGKPLALVPGEGKPAEIAAELAKWVA